MLRWLYIRLIRLHPARFRWRFGDQMLDIFDGAGRRARLRYLADAAASLGRQWVLRPEFRGPEATAAAGETGGAPLFAIIETYKPQPAALVQGGVLAMVSIAVMVVLIGKGGSMARPFLIGMHFSRPGLLSIDRNSMTGGDLNITVKVGPDPGDTWLKLARPYFASMPVLRALDADGDLTLSPREIGNAPGALRELDADHDGRLTAEECGLGVDGNSMSAAALGQLRRRFMSFHPVLAALDAGQLGEIPAREIAHAAAALKTLDRNGDGYLTADELIPVEMASRAGLR